MRGKHLRQQLRHQRQLEASALKIQAWWRRCLEARLALEAENRDQLEVRASLVIFRALSAWRLKKPFLAKRRAAIKIQVTSKLRLLPLGVSKVFLGLVLCLS